VAVDVDTLAAVLRAGGEVGASGGGMGGMGGMM
jgi:hypothetical protein